MTNINNKGKAERNKGHTNPANPLTFEHPYMKLEYPSFVPKKRPLEKKKEENNKGGHSKNIYIAHIKGFPTQQYPKSHYPRSYSPTVNNPKLGLHCCRTNTIFAQLGK